MPLSGLLLLPFGLPETVEVHFRVMSASCILLSIMRVWAIKSLNCGICRHHVSP